MMPGKVDNLPQNVNDNRFLGASGVSGHTSRMKEAFRESFIRHIRVYDVSIAEVARATGVSKYLLNALHQRKTSVPNVADAIRIASFFGKTVEEFIAPESGEKVRDRLSMLAKQLTPEERAMLEAQIDVLLSRRS